MRAPRVTTWLDDGMMIIASGGLMWLESPTATTITGSILAAATLFILGYILKRGPPSSSGIPSGGPSGGPGVWTRVKGFAAEVRAVFGDWAAPLSGGWRAGLVLTGAVAVAVAVDLLVFTGRPVPALVAGVVAGSLSVLPWWRLLVGWRWRCWRCGWVRGGRCRSRPGSRCSPRAGPCRGSTRSG
jgi:hypothetical protein